VNQRRDCHCSVVMDAWEVAHLHVCIARDGIAWTLPCFPKHTRLFFMPLLECATTPREKRYAHTTFDQAPHVHPGDRPFTHLKRAPIARATANRRRSARPLTVTERTRPRGGVWPPDQTRPVLRGATAVRRHGAPRLPLRRPRQADTHGRTLLAPRARGAARRPTRTAGGSHAASVAPPARPSRPPGRRRPRR